MNEVLARKNKATIFFDPYQLYKLRQRYHLIRLRIAIQIPTAILDADEKMKASEVFKSLLLNTKIGFLTSYPAKYLLSSL